MLNLDSTIKRVTSRYPKAIREDLIQECSLYALEQPDCTERTLKQLCDRFKYHNHNRNLSLNETAYTDENGDDTEFIDLLEGSTSIDTETDVKMQLADFMASIPQNHGHVLKLYHQDGYAPDEIVELFGRGLEISSTHTVYAIIEKYKADADQ